MTQTSSTTSSTGKTGKVALHQKLRPKGRPPKGKPPKGGKPPKKALTLGQNIDQQILQAISGNFNEKTVRTKLLQMALGCEGAVGVCFLSKDIQDQWTPSISSPTVGRVPDRREFAKNFSERCDQIAQSGNAQMEEIPSLKGLPGLFAPIRPRGSQPEIMLLILRSKKDAILATGPLQKIATGQRIWMNGRDSADRDWQVFALGSIIELIGKIENQTTVKAAAEEAANLLANRMGCNSVAVGLFHKGKMRLEAISGVSKLDHGSDSSRNYLQSLVESTTRQQAGLFPAIDDDNNFLLQAHKQLAATTQSEAVYSQPLIDEDDAMLGSIVFTGPKSLLETSQVERFNDTAAPAIANALRVVEKVKSSTLTRTKAYVKRKIPWTKRLVGIGLLIGLCLLMFLPITYKVRCSCVTEPVSRRFAVAPFDGQIVLGHVEAGDFVEANAVLAEMNGREIRWQLSGVSAERKQSLRTREMELSERNVANTILAQLEFDRLVSEEEILQYKRDHLQIKSPIDGVVLSGSLERAEAASVETGQVLFEIGPIKPMRVEISIPSNEIAQIDTGCEVKVWIDGQEDDPIVGEIKKIHPRSETRDAQNVFIAELEFPNDDERLRPGMKGSARIDGNKRSLGWSMFHKPMNYVRSHLTWW